MDLTSSAYYCHFATKEEAKAFVALGKLIQLRDKYWRLDNNWKPDWDDNTEKYCINCSGSRIFYETWKHYNKILAFRTSELRNKFNANFKDLIEEAEMFL